MILQLLDFFLWIARIHGIMKKDEIFKLVKDYYQQEFAGKKFVPGQSLVPSSGKVFDEDELINMIDSVLEGWWTDNRYVADLEKRLAEYVGVKYCALVNSGSSANLIAFASLTSPGIKDKRIKEGDEVIAVAVSFPTTINPILIYKCVPVFLDVDLKTCEIDVSRLEEALSEKTKAVFIAHTLGNSFNVKAVREFCEKHNLWLIEDNCDALGAEYEGQKTGSFGDMSTVSFYPAHHITTAEGGAVFTDSPVLNMIVRSIRDWGRDCWCGTGKDDTCCKRFGWKLGELPHGYDHKYVYKHIGYNLKMTDIQAACGVAQMDKLDSFVAKRRENYEILRGKLSEFSEYFDFVEATEGCSPSWFGLVITLKDGCGFERRRLIEFLTEKKIGTRLVFAGNITKQPYFSMHAVDYRVVGNLKNTDKIMNDTFWIGLYPALGKEHFDYVRDCFEEFISSKKVTYA